MLSLVLLFLLFYSFLLLFSFFPLFFVSGELDRNLFLTAIALSFGSSSSLSEVVGDYICTSIAHTTVDGDTEPSDMMDTSSELIGEFVRLFPFPADQNSRPCDSGHAMLFPHVLD